ncbi:MAG: TAXI family TRAP transporter solute-binding subunit [Neofamilia sp.]
MIRNKKIALILVAMMLVSAFVACQGGTKPAETPADKPAEGTEKPAEGAEKPAPAGGGEFISIATGGTGGTYYPLGGAMATILNGSDMGVQATAQATGASVENVELIHIGDAEVAFVQNDIAYYAFNGIELFEGNKYEDIAGLATLYPEVVQIIAAANSGIESVEDMAGKRIAVGAPGSGTEVNARQVLEIHGLTYEDLALADYLSFTEATDQIKNGQVDAAFVVAAVPSSAVTELATTHDIKLVPIAEDKANELIAKYPYYTYLDIATEEYRGFEGTVKGVAVQAMLIVNKDMDDELAYNITKNIFTNLDAVAESHARGKDITIESALDGMPIEIHPGAQRFFDEQ